MSGILKRPVGNHFENTDDERANAMRVYSEKKKQRSFYCKRVPNLHLRSGLGLTLSCNIFKNGQRTLKILRCEHRQILKVYLAIFLHHKWKS